MSICAIFFVMLKGLPLKIIHIFTFTRLSLWLYQSNIFATCNWKKLNNKDLTNLSTLQILHVQYTSGIVDIWRELVTARNKVRHAPLCERHHEIWRANYNIDVKHWVMWHVTLPSAKATNFMVKILRIWQDAYKEMASNAEMPLNNSPASDSRSMNNMDHCEDTDRRILWVQGQLNNTANVLRAPRRKFYRWTNRARVSLVTNLRCFSVQLEVSLHETGWQKVFYTLLKSAVFFSVFLYQISFE